jgi:hypothetical protein
MSLFCSVLARSSSLSIPKGNRPSTPCNLTDISTGFSNQINLSPYDSRRDGQHPLVGYERCGPHVGLHEHDGIGEAFTSKRELSRVLVDFQGGGSQMLEFVTKLELGSGSPMPEDGMLDSMSPNKSYLLSMLNEAFQKYELLLRPATAWTRRHLRTTVSTLDLTCRRRMSGSGAIPSSDSNAASLILSPSR